MHSWSKHQWISGYNRDPEAVIEYISRYDDMLAWIHIIGNCDVDPIFLFSKIRERDNRMKTFIHMLYAYCLEIPFEDITTELRLELTKLYLWGVMNEVGEISELEPIVEY